MKRLIAILAAGCSLAVAAPVNDYVVTGTFGNAQEGDTVVLQDYQARAFVTLQKTTVVGGVFRFEVATDTIEQRWVCHTDAAGKQQRVTLIGEEGVITVTPQEGGEVVAGTPLTDKLSAFNDKQNELAAPLKALLQRYNAEGTSESEKKEIIAQYDAVEEMMTAAIEETIRENIDNALGLILFVRYASSLDMDVQEALVTAMPSTSQQNVNVQRIVARIETDKRVRPGNQFIDFTEVMPDGSTLCLSDVVKANKLTMIDFWASWCGPCRREMPAVKAAYEAYHDKGFEIVGVSLDRDATAWKNGIEKLGITWPQVSDLQYWNSAAAALYAVRSIPATFLIDQNGTIVARGVRGDEIMKALAERLD